MIPISINEDENIPKDTNKLWDQVGFHRPLAGFWYKLVFELLTLLIPALLVTYVVKWLYPFPQIKGYYTTFAGFFTLIFTVFDIGTANTISRYIADQNIKNPRTMLKYIQYFIWYQAFTGLAQITVITLWALFFAPSTEYAYGIWIILFICTKQYPGSANIFKDVLGSMQAYNKTATIDFIQSEAFQRISEIGFLLLGRWYGSTHPEIGMILAMSIFMVYGLYLDDYIAAMIAGFSLAKVLKPYGIRFRDLFGCEFDGTLVKETLTFGIKTGFPSILSASTSTYALLLFIELIPQYTTFITLQDMSIELVAISERLVKQDFAPMFTEAYQNKKFKLCEYYNAHVLRFLMLNTGFAVAIMLIAISILPNVFIQLELDQYYLTIPFLIPALIYRATKVYFGYPDSLLVSAGKANVILIVNTIEQFARWGTVALTLLVFRVQDLGLPGIIYALSLIYMPISVIKAIFLYTYINKRIFHLRIMPWQTFGVPILTTTILFTVFYVLKIIILDRLWIWSFFGTLVIGVIGLIVLALGFYFPLTVALGGWDDNSIRDFKKVYRMAGPSKFFVIPIAKLVFMTARHAPLHNKFKFHSPEALQQVQELITLRDSNRIKS